MNEEKYEQLVEFYKDLIEDLTIDDVCLILDELNVPYVNRANSDIISIKTCCHNLDLGAAKYNLKYYKDNKTFFCFSQCNTSYDLADLLQQVFKIRHEEKSFMQVLKWICDVLDRPFDYEVKETKTDKYNWQKDLFKYINKSENIIEDNKVYDDSILNYFPKIYYEEWLRYGISIETLEKYNIRWYPYKNQIVIPCYDECGYLIGIRVRNMDKEKLDNGIAKYIPLKLLDGTEYNFKTGQYLYGLYQNQDYIKESKSVIIVESEKAVEKADTLFNGKSNVVALLGSNLSDWQFNKIISLGVRKLIISLDSDFKTLDSDEFKKFKQKVIKIKKIFYNYVDEIYVVFNNIGLDMYKENIFDVSNENRIKLWNGKVRLK